MPQVFFVGVINPQNPRVETAEQVCEDLMLASKYIPKERPGSTDDCGFSPFSIDVKPWHGSPDGGGGCSLWTHACLPYPGRGARLDWASKR